ncbi:hypothetical protein WIS52_06705 [Pseudonocardia nematodicida]|uniref:Uncharacterized protein n=1 Tax=Pseudonocardia nematodicida TaxID=1206997 RepID=A0ABV1K9V3_9PSEU
MTSPVLLASSALKKASELLAALTVEQLVDLVEGRGRLVFQSGDKVVASGRTRQTGARSKPTPELDLPVELAAIEALDTADQVYDHLVGRKFTVPVLRRIATAIGPRVSSSGRTKEQILRNIAEGTAGHRHRVAAMAGDSWA